MSYLYDTTEAAESTSPSRGQTIGLINTGPGSVQAVGGDKPIPLKPKATYVVGSAPDVLVPTPPAGVVRGNAFAVNVNGSLDQTVSYGVRTGTSNNDGQAEKRPAGFVRVRAGAKLATSRVGTGIGTAATADDENRGTIRGNVDQVPLDTIKFDTNEPQLLSHDYKNSEINVQDIPTSRFWDDGSISLPSSERDTVPTVFARPAFQSKQTNTAFYLPTAKKNHDITVPKISESNRFLLPPENLRNPPLYAYSPTQSTFLQPKESPDSSETYQNSRKAPALAAQAVDDNAQSNVQPQLQDQSKDGFLFFPYENSNIKQNDEHDTFTTSEDLAYPGDTIPVIGSLTNNGRVKQPESMKSTTNAGKGLQSQEAETQRGVRFGSYTSSEAVVHQPSVLVGNSNAFTSIGVPIQDRQRNSNIPKHIQADNTDYNPSTSNDEHIPLSASDQNENSNSYVGPHFVLPQQVTSLRTGQYTSGDAAMDKMNTHQNPQDVPTSSLPENTRTSFNLPSYLSSFQNQQAQDSGVLFDSILNSRDTGTSRQYGSESQAVDKQHYRAGLPQEYDDHLSQQQTRDSEYITENGVPFQQPTLNSNVRFSEQLQNERAFFEKPLELQQSKYRANSGISVDNRQQSVAIRNSQVYSNIGVSANLSPSADNHIPDTNEDFKKVVQPESLQNTQLYNTNLGVSVNEPIETAGVGNVQYFGNVGVNVGDKPKQVPIATRELSGEANLGQRGASPTSYSVEPQNYQRNFPVVNGQLLSEVPEDTTAESKVVQQDADGRYEQKYYVNSNLPVRHTYTFAPEANDNVADAASLSNQKFTFNVGTQQHQQQQQLLKLLEQQGGQQEDGVSAGSHGLGTNVLVQDKQPRYAPYETAQQVVGVQINDQQQVDRAGNNQRSVYKNGEDDNLLRNVQKPERPSKTEQHLRNFGILEQSTQYVGADQTQQAIESGFHPSGRGQTVYTNYNNGHQENEFYPNPHRPLNIATDESHSQSVMRQDYPDNVLQQPNARYSQEQAQERADDSLHANRQTDIQNNYKFNIAPLQDQRELPYGPQQQQPTYRVEISDTDAPAEGHVTQNFPSSFVSVREPRPEAETVKVGNFGAYTNVGVPVKEKPQLHLKEQNQPTVQFVNLKDRTLSRQSQEAMLSSTTDDKYPLNVQTFVNNQAEAVVPFNVRGIPENNADNVGEATQVVPVSGPDNFGAFDNRGLFNPWAKRNGKIPLPLNALVVGGRKDENKKVSDFFPTDLEEYAKVNVRVNDPSEDDRSYIRAGSLNKPAITQFSFSPSKPEDQFASEALYFPWTTTSTPQQQPITWLTRRERPGFMNPWRTEQSATFMNNEQDAAGETLSTVNQTSFRSFTTESPAPSTTTSSYGYRVTTLKPYGPAHMASLDEKLSGMCYSNR